jgi:phage tail-like protein
VFYALNGRSLERASSLRAAREGGVLMAKAKEPRPTSFFRVTLGGKESIGVFREVSGLSSETEVTEEREVDDRGRPIVRRVPGATKWGNITLKRAVDNNLGLWKWRKQVLGEGPDAARVDGAIELLDVQGRPVATYRFSQGWPSKYQGPELNATSNEVAIETIEITHEGLERS